MFNRNEIVSGLVTAAVLSIAAANGYLWGKLIVDKINANLANDHREAATEALKKSYAFHKQSVDAKEDGVANLTKSFKYDADHILAHYLDHAKQGNEAFKLRYARAVNDYCKLLNGQKLD